MRHFTHYTIVSFLILILIGQTYSALGQTAPIANHVVINEADINPVGDDTNYPIDWVELYNPTSSSVNVGGWTVGATSGLQQIYTIPSNTMLSSKQFMILMDGPMWFPHAGAVIQLKSNTGTVIDQTPPLTDFQGGGSSWQRITDGYDTGSSSDWVYKMATPGSSNGQLTTTTTVAPATMTFTTDKTSYIFGDTVTMSGTVSKLLTDPVLGYSLSINMVVSGPMGFQKTFTMYPSANLKFSTSMPTSQATGFPEGNYTVSVSYGTITASDSFMLGSTPFVPPTQAAQITMSVSTDQSSYTALQPITLSGNVSQIIPLTPVVYKVYEPNDTMIYQGNLFPDSQGHFTTYSQFQAHSSASGIVINSVTPIYGTYTVAATYGTAKATTSFTVVPQKTQSTPIIVSTDKQVYGLGDTVQISGSTQLAGLQNSGLSPSLEIIQSSAIGTVQGSVPQTLDIKTFVTMVSSNTFTYSFLIPNDPSRLGDYRVIVSTPSAQSEADFVVAQNPSTYQAVATTGPLSIVTDKSLYAYGDSIVMSGKIQSSSIVQGVQVQITVVNSTGSQMYSQANLLVTGAAISQSTPLAFFAYPDSSGNYLVQQTLTPSVFVAGTYTLKVSYNNLIASTTFTVYNPLDTGSQGPIVATLDKQVYGVGDTVHLTGKLSSLTGTSAYTLELFKPDGSVITSPLAINNGLFSWNFTVPSQATFNTLSTITTNRASSSGGNFQTNLYGIYAVTVSSDYGNSEVYFQVSPNPQNQTAITPFDIETDKTEYNNTDVVNIFGQTIPQSNNNTASQYANTPVQMTIYNQTGGQAYQYSATLNQGGQFRVSVPLQPGVWSAGTYKIYAQYLTYSGTVTFQVDNPYAVGSGVKQILLATDNTQYLPGQTVLITGRTGFIMSLADVDLTFGLANDTIVSEGQVTSQQGTTLPQVTVPLDQYGTFSYAYKIPATASLGNYTIAAQVPFGVFNAYYQVVNQLPPTNTTSHTNSTQITPPLTNTTQAPTKLAVIPTTIGPTQARTTSSVIVDKENMISTSQITISANEKTNGSQTYYPTEIDGLLRVNPGDESAVSLKVDLPNGTCIIGSSAGCKISQSTSQAGLLYQSTIVGNETFLVGFSGPDQRIQQFSVLPASANDNLPVGQWSVDIIKNNQVSRFYYQVTYLTK